MVRISPVEGLVMRTAALVTFSGFRRSNSWSMICWAVC